MTKAVPQPIQAPDDEINLIELVSYLWAGKFRIALFAADGALLDQGPAELCAIH